MSEEHAVIYARVSTVRQTKDGSGLASQAARCAEYARFKGMRVIATFEDSKSGALIDRPGMKAMLTYLRKHRKDRITVIIDDVSRLARSIRAHVELREAIAATGAKLVSPNLEFSDDCDSILQENILATMSQHMRQKNAEQTKNRRRSRMLNGYWVHFAPRGYKYTNGAQGGRVLVRDEPLASIIAEGLERYASGAFTLKAEMKRFFESFPEFPKNGKGCVTDQEVDRILNRVVYAGYIESQIMDISLRPAKHAGLISLETYQKIQDRQNKKAVAPARKNLDEAFPLRGSVFCGDCGKPMTGCYSKGRTNTYPYYSCFSKGCNAFSKSIRREDLEAQFENILGTLTPSPALHGVVSKMVKTWWSYRHDQLSARTSSCRREAQRLSEKIEQAMDRLIESDSPSLQIRFEAKIKTLETERAVLLEQASATPKARSYDEALRTVMTFLASPCKYWKNGTLKDRHVVLKLAFPQGLIYCRNQGLRTAQTPSLFGFLGVGSAKTELAEREGFEPPVGMNPQRFSRPPH
jgi:site-specific DNA recombinase